MGQSPETWACKYLRTKHFHGVSSRNQHPRLLKPRYGKVSRFSPQWADIGDTRLWRIDPNADYGVLNNLARHRLHSDLIVDHWDDRLRLAGSLKLGAVQAHGIMRTLQVGDRPTKLAAAIAE